MNNVFSNSFVEDGLPVAVFGHPAASAGLQAVTLPPLPLTGPALLGTGGYFSH